MNLTKTQLIDEVRPIARDYHIDPLLVCAIVEVESDRNPWAMRYEPNYRWLFNVKDFARHHGVSQATEHAAQVTSWGLMQLMGAVARERGFGARYLSELCVVGRNLSYGCLHLSWLVNSKGYTETDDLISAYNQGSPRKSRDGVYVNFRYVERVKKAHAMYEKIRDEY